MAADRWMQERAKELAAEYSEWMRESVMQTALRAMEEQRERDAVLAFDKTQHFPELAKQVAAAIRRGGE